MEYIYFDVFHALKEHDYIIKFSGGLQGVKDEGHLKAIIEFVQNDSYYSTIEEKASYLFYALNKGHVFIDGNKRTAVVLTAYFFELNGLGCIVGRFMRDVENIAVDVADNIINRDLLFEIIRSFIYDDEFTDELKFKIIEAKTNFLSQSE